MELNFLKTLLGYAGLGGLCTGVLFLLFRKVIGANFLSKISKEHSYKIVNNIIGSVRVFVCEAGLRRSLI
jgi:hypothetical protein